MGSNENARRLPATYHNEAEAKVQAEAANKRTQRGAATLAYTLALGRPDLYPEQSETVSVFKAEIDSTKWLIEKTTHTITGTAGLTTQLDMETGI